MNGQQSTPKTIGLSIKRFLNIASLRGIPVYLQFTDLGKNYKKGYCLNNCEREHLETDCTIIYGWMIWELKETSYVESEFHSVIESNGELIDITPRVDGEEEILFIRDDSREPRRTDKHSWKTWSNIKSQRGKIIEHAKSIKIVDAATYGT